jgi:hypothetical protein
VRQKSSNRSSRSSRSEQQDGFERRVALAQCPADAERAFGVLVGDDDRAGPSVAWLVLHRDRRVLDGLPRVPREVERLREQGRGRSRKDQQGFGTLDVSHGYSEPR